MIYIDFRRKTMGLIAVNIIGLIMFILAIVMFVLADSMVGIAIGVAISVVWLTFTITANVHIQDHLQCGSLLIATT